MLFSCSCVKIHLWPRLCFAIKASTDAPQKRAAATHKEAARQHLISGAEALPGPPLARMSLEIVHPSCGAPAPPACDPSSLASSATVLETSRVQSFSCLLFCIFCVAWQTRPSHGFALCLQHGSYTHLRWPNTLQLETPDLYPVYSRGVRNTACGYSPTGPNRSKRSNGYVQVSPRHSNVIYQCNTAARGLRQDAHAHANEITCTCYDPTSHTPSQSSIRQSFGLDRTF